MKFGDVVAPDRQPDARFMYIGPRVSVPHTYGTWEYLLWLKGHTGPVPFDDRDVVGNWPMDGEWVWKVVEDEVR